MLLRVLFLSLCALAAFAPLGAPRTAQSPRAAAAWPASFEGAPLTRLPLTAAEETFNSGFPGETALFTDGRRRFIARWATAPTRRLHSSADCFRGSGYRITETPPVRDARGERWSTFTAARGATVLRVCERLRSTKTGAAWTDASAWYWSALLHPDTGPWLSLTVVEQARTDID